MDNGSMDKKIECGQENLSVLSVSVSVCPKNLFLVVTHFNAL